MHLFLYASLSLACSKNRKKGSNLPITLGLGAKGLEYMRNRTGHNKQDDFSMGSGITMKRFILQFGNHCTKKNAKTDTPRPPDDSDADLILCLSNVSHMLSVR